MKILSTVLLILMSLFFILLKVGFFGDSPHTLRSANVVFIESKPCFGGYSFQRLLMGTPILSKFGIDQDIGDFSNTSVNLKNETKLDANCFGEELLPKIKLATGKHEFQYSLFFPKRDLTLNYRGFVCSNGGILSNCK